jgi:hypothetical protein
MHQGSEPPSGLSLWFDRSADTRVGSSSVLRLRVGNCGAEPLSSVRLWLKIGEQALERADTAVLGPGEECVVALSWRPRWPGLHALAGVLESAQHGGEVGGRWRLVEVNVGVGPRRVPQQSVRIHALEPREASLDPAVGDWRGLELLSQEAAEEEITEPELVVGQRGAGIVEAVGEVLRVRLGGVLGTVVETDDPEALARLVVGDPIRVLVIGHASDGPVFSTREVTADMQAPPRPMRIEVREGGLAQAVAEAPVGAILVVSGEHRGPISLDRPLTLSCEGALLRVSSGAGLTVTSDARLIGLRVVGDAAAGAYAPDGVEVLGCRAVLEACDIRVNSVDNLTPGRGVVVKGRGEVFLDGCRLHKCGVAVAVGVSWAGVPSGSPQGAQAHVRRCFLEDNGVGVAIAGPGATLVVAHTVFRGHSDVAVRALLGARAQLDDCLLPGGGTSADDSSAVTVENAR